MKCDVTVVGAGPCGLTLAETIASEGNDVVILEEHPEIGSPRHCTGKISVNALRELELEASGILQTVRGATFYPPSLEPVTIKRDEPQAFILDRKIYDQALSKRAIDAGAKLLTNAQAKKFSITPDNVTISFEQSGKTCKVDSKLVVGADGATSLIARLTGLYSKKQHEVRIGVQRDVADIKPVQGIVELYFGRNWAPKFFAWIVPTSSDTARAGLAVPLNTPKPPFKYLDDFMEKHPVACERLRGCRVLGQSAHIIPTGGALRRTVSDGVLIVGDAAGQVKSTTGGGLFYGVACAKIAGKTVSKALRSRGGGVLRSKALMSYEEEWRERFGSEIAFSVRARAFLDSLTDGEVDYLFDVIRGDESLIRRIEVDGDIDRQSKVALSLLSYAKYAIKKPKLMYKLRKFFPLPKLT